LLFASVAPQYGEAAAVALQTAIEAEYPEYLADQRRRLDKILDRWRISTQSEFMLIRHAIDVAEGHICDQAALNNMYQLVDAFEGRRRARGP